MPTILPQQPFVPPPHHRAPRIILYQQTHHQHQKEDEPEQVVSLLPLLTATPSPCITHLILAAVHLNHSEPILTLNNHPPPHPRFIQLWDEVLALRDAGVKVLCMLGGAALGTLARLDYSPVELNSLPAPSALIGTLPPPREFETFYTPLFDFIRTYDLDGIDLDVEEDMSLEGIVHLIDRLRKDFGPSSSFLITFAPVCTALVRGMRHLSGFDYFKLEALRGGEIDWYHVQFYNGWGDLHDSDSSLLLAPSPAHSSTQVGKEQRLAPVVGGWYDHIVSVQGWRPEKVVVGLLTNPRHGGSGYVAWDVLARVLGGLVQRYEGRFGGVMGWEYWGAVPELEAHGARGRGRKEDGEGNGEEEEEEEVEEESHYWRWAWRMRWILSLKEITDRAVVVVAGRSLAAVRVPLG